MTSNFLQVFLWELLKGLDVFPLPYSQARLIVDFGKDSYIPYMLSLICRWFKRMHRKSQNFLGLLDSVENFIFHPYGVFKHVPFHADIDRVVEAHAVTAQGRYFWEKKCLVECCMYPFAHTSRQSLEGLCCYLPLSS